jgi:hypothetical protein
MDAKGATEAEHRREDRRKEGKTEGNSLSKIPPHKAAFRRGLVEAMQLLSDANVRVHIIKQISVNTNTNM